MPNVANAALTPSNGGHDRIGLRPMKKCLGAVLLLGCVLIGVSTHLLVYGTPTNAIAMTISKSTTTTTTPNVPTLTKEAILVIAATMPVGSHYERGLQHIVETSNRPVHLLIDAAEVEHNRPNRASWWNRVHVDTHSTPPATLPFSMFGNVANAKSKLIQWQVDHSDAYTHVIHIEPDTYFSGTNWSDILDTLDDGFDMHANYHEQQPSWFWAQKCRMEINQKVHLCNIQGKYTQTNAWFFRMSTTFAQEIHRMLKDRLFYGHHEVVLYPMCVRANCTWSKYMGPGWDNGVLVAGHDVSLTGTLHQLLQSKNGTHAVHALYHPVKKIQT